MAAECFLRNVPEAASEAEVRKALEKFGYVAALRFVDLIRPNVPKQNRTIQRRIPAESLEFSRLDWGERLA
jgi:hypothetical protein